MRSVTVNLDDDDFDRLADAASRSGRSIEDALGELLRCALDEDDARLRALAQLGELERLPPVEEQEAMRRAVEGVRAMRAERRARRP